MKIDLEYPFQDYNGYTVINPENRKNICLVHKNTKHKTTISYARYLMSVKEKRFLNVDDEVDHIDGDKTNDVLDNLQIITKLENNKKRLIETNSTKKMVKLKCPNCNLVFSKPLNNTFLQKGGKYSTCSKKCNYEILRKKYTNDELIELGKNQILEHYRK